METCDYCYGAYEKGKGVSEDDRHRIRLTERFCSDSCAADYNADLTEENDD